MKRIITILIYFAVLIVCTYTVIADNECTNKTLSADQSNYYIIASDGGLYCVPYKREENEGGGYSDFYYDIEINDLTPIRIMDDTVNISWNYILKEDHTLWKWNQEENKAEFISDQVKKVSGSSTHVLFIKEDDTLWGMGSNLKGQLAQGKMEYSVEEQLELKEQGKLHELDRAVCIPKQYDEPIIISEKIKSVVAGENCSYFLKSDGVVYCCGYIPDTGESVGRFFRRMNNVPEKFMENVKEIFGGGLAGFAIVNDGKDTMWRWGTSEINVAGAIDAIEPVRDTDNVKSISVHPGFNYIIKNDDSLWIYSSMDRSAFSDLYGIQSEIDLPRRLMDGVNYSTGSIYCDGIRDRQMVLKNTGELYILEFDESGKEYSMFKLKNNIRLSGEEPVVREYSDLADLSDEEITAVNKLSKANIVNGTGETSFSPDKTVNRAEAAALLLRMIGKKDASDISDFNDVTNNKWYYNIAGASQRYNIIKGYEDNTFRGEENISGLQLLSISARVLRDESVKEITQAKIKLPENIPIWAAEDVSMAINGGLVTVEEAEELADSEGVTRGKAAVLLYRLYNKI